MNAETVYEHVTAGYFHNDALMWSRFSLLVPIELATFGFAISHDNAVVSCAAAVAGTLGVFVVFTLYNRNVELRKWYWTGLTSAHAQESNNTVNAELLAAARRKYDTLLCGPKIAQVALFIVFAVNGALFSLRLMVNIEATSVLEWSFKQGCSFALLVVGIFVGCVVSIALVRVAVALTRNHAGYMPNAPNF